MIVGVDALDRWSRSIGIVSAAATASVVGVAMATTGAEQSAVCGRHHRQLSFNESIESR